MMFKADMGTEFRVNVTTSLCRAESAGTLASAKQTADKPMAQAFAGLIPRFVPVAHCCPPRGSLSKRSEYATTAARNCAAIRPANASSPKTSFMAATRRGQRPWSVQILFAWGLGTLAIDRSATATVAHRERQER